LVEQCFLLTRFGDVFVDRDDGRLWPADDEEREFAYVQTARRFPQYPRMDRRALM
jgi:uncharacterized protein YifE (UPF0438 family)